MPESLEDCAELAAEVRAVKARWENLRGWLYLSGQARVETIGMVAFPADTAEARRMFRELSAPVLKALDKARHISPESAGRIRENMESMAQRARHPWNSNSGVSVPWRYERRVMKEIDSLEKAHHECEVAALSLEPGGR